MKSTKNFYIEALGFAVAVHIAGFFLIILFGFMWPATTNEIIEVTLAAGDVYSVAEDDKDLPGENKQTEQLKETEEIKEKEQITDHMLPPEIKPEQQTKKRKQTVSAGKTEKESRHGDRGQDDITSMPKILKQVKPDYPPAARNTDKQGRVMVELVIGNRGVVEQAEILQSGGFAALDEAVLKAVYKWRFAPAKNRYGRPCACKVVIPVKFELREQE